LADGLVIPTGHSDQAVNTDVVESLKVLLAVHLDLQLHPDELVHGPRLFEVLARWGRTVNAIKERLRELVVESGQAVGEGSTESGDVRDACGQGWGGQQVVEEWCDAGLGDLGHPISAVHGSRFVECSHDGAEQLRVDDRCTEV